MNTLLSRTALLLSLLPATAAIASTHKPVVTMKKSSAHHVVATTHRVAPSSHRAAAPAGRHPAMAATAARTRRGAKPVLAARRTRAVYGERFTASSFADNITSGDVTAGEDPAVRAAAIEALGNYNGTALAIDPSSGRILAMVNQKLALSSGAEPCSTIKLSVALAALQEGLIRHDTPVSLGGSYRIDLDYALAKSVNLYFEVLGRQMGFERVRHYATEFGLGELAGYNIQGEQLGVYPDTELPAAQGGVGRMCSFGESISMTPLQLGALVGAIANGGTLYYLQHPQSPEELAAFQPKVKRILNIAPILPEIKPGMAGAVAASYGTARSLKASFQSFPVFGKTGTCSNNGTRFGWFASYSETPAGRIVTVIFLEGGKPTFGPKAAELTGLFYGAMNKRGFFASKGIGLPTPPVPDTTPATGVSRPPADNQGSSLPATAPTSK